LYRKIKKLYLKNSIKIVLLFFSLPLFAQLEFKGKAEAIGILNSPNGQNYLVMDQNDGTFSWTEEAGGTGDESELLENEVGPFKAYIFKDWLGTKGLVSPIGFLDGSLYYNHVIFNKGVYYGLVMERSLQGGTAKPAQIPFFRNKSAHQSGCMSADGRYMILSLQSNNTYGVEDLYVTIKDSNGDWSSLKNLGFEVNSEYQEITPFLATDNKTLFFASNGRNGEGSFDIYYTVRQDDSWRNWSEPINLDKKVNTSGAETSFVFRDGDEWAYFISSQDSDGYGDIMRIRINEAIDADTTSTDPDEPSISTTSLIAEVEVELEPNEIILKVVDHKSKEAIPTNLLRETDTIQNIDGIFTIEELTGEEVEIKSKGFLPKIVMLDEQLTYGENIIELSSVTKGSVIKLDHVLFLQGTDRMIEGSQKELDLVVEMMNDNPTIKILLKGHTDNRGDPVRNIQLSEARVKAVKEYILSRGVSPYRVTGRGYGGNQPIASNETEETRKLNRRVEFEVIAD